MPRLIASGVSSNDIKTIVDKHNELRMSVAEGQVPGQPRATDMITVEWDDKLQALAQSWANRMSFNHNSSRKDGRFYVGENLYISYSSETGKEPDWDKAIQSWFDEHKMYRYGPIGNVANTGHYTQVIWSKTQYIGCGYAVYMENGMTTKLYVCNYGPGGNMMGQCPYKSG